jgi:hypothetical protein
MAFNLTNLRSDTRFLIFNDSTNTLYADTDLDRNANRWYNTGVVWVLTANGEWQVNGEIATTDLVAGQREYILPGDILKLNEVYIKTTSDQSEYVKMKQRDPINVDIDIENYHPYPPEFDLLDNSMFIYILEDSITDVTAGFKIHYQSDITELSTGTDKPNLAEPFKRLLTYGSAYDYCMANEMWSKCKILEKQIEIIKNDMLDFYASRSTVKSAILEPKQENYY